MRILCVVAFGLAVALPGVAAIAANVEVAGGQVSLNGGKGYARLNGLAAAKAGDTVMAGPNSSATITYGNGCSLPVGPGKVVVVPADSACTPEMLASNGNEALYAIGGVAVVGGAIAAVLLNKSKSASP